MRVSAGSHGIPGTYDTASIARRPMPPAWEKPLRKYHQSRCSRTRPLSPSRALRTYTVDRLVTSTRCNMRVHTDVPSVSVCSRCRRVRERCSGDRGRRVSTPARARICSRTYTPHCLGPSRSPVPCHGPCGVRPPEPSHTLPYQSGCVRPRYADLTRGPEESIEATERCTNHGATRRAEGSGASGDGYGWMFCGRPDMDTRRDVFQCRSRLARQGCACFAK